MALAPKRGTTNSLVRAAVGAAPKIGTTQTAEERRAAEQAAREAAPPEQQARRVTQQQGRKALQELTGRHYGNLNPTRRGKAPELEAFLDGALYSRFSSSNVEAIQYDPTQHQLYVRFRGGRWYRYDAVSELEAELFWAGFSKGSLVWDILRIRGTKDGHRKSYTRDAAPPDYLPLPRTYPLETYGQGGAAQDILRGVSQNPIT